MVRPASTNISLFLIIEMKTNAPKFSKADWIWFKFQISLLFSVGELTLIDSVYAIRVRVESSNKAAAWPFVLSVDETDGAGNHVVRRMDLFHLLARHANKNVALASRSVLRCSLLQARPTGVRINSHKFRKSDLVINPCKCTCSYA